MRQLVLTLALLAVSPVITVIAEDGQAQGERCGSCKGKVISNETKGQLTVQTEKGIFTYWVRWIGGMPKDGGGPDKEMMAKVKELTPGDYVEVKWEHTDEHVRIVGLNFIAHADGSRERPKGDGEREREQPAAEREKHGEREQNGGKPNEAAAYLDGPGPSEKCGFMRGVVTTVDPKGRFVIRSEKGEEVFVPQWRGGMPTEGGGFDQEMIAKIAQLKAGQQVDVTWEWNERKRCVGLKVAGN